MKEALNLVLVVGAAIGGIAAYVFLRERHRRGEHRELKSEIGKWEGEGGNVPQVPTPAPVETPRQSVPPERRTDG